MDSPLFTNRTIQKVLAPLTKHQYRWAGGRRFLSKIYAVYECRECQKRITYSIGELPNLRQYGCTGRKEHIDEINTKNNNTKK